METRTMALEWFNKLSNEKQLKLVELHLSDRPFVGRDYLTGREIEQIFLKETSPVDKTDIESAYISQVKPKKQFTEFDPEKFKLYINKFTNQDKLKAILEIIILLDKDQKAFYKAIINEALNDK